MSVSIETYGCKVNHYDTGLLQGRLNNKELGEKKVVVINSCAVTEEATKEALRRIRKIKSNDPETTVVVTGCAAQVDTEKFVGNEYADLVVANSHKGQLSEIIQDFHAGRSSEQVFKSNIFKKLDLEDGGGLTKDHTRSFLKIQDGCNSFCTFCVIPFARGKSRSIPIDDLVERVNEIYDNGVREIVLTGVHIGDYEDGYFGADNPRGLEDLVEQLLVRTKMPRFRLSSLEPIELSERLLEMYNETAMCPHFHMSIQSANTKVLRDMKRNYTAVEVENSLNAIQKKVPGAFVGMDVIAGFPGETVEEFEDTMNRLSGLPWTRIHAFPYSERPGTFANRMGGKMHRSEIMQRTKLMREMSSERYAKMALSQVGSVKSVMCIKSKLSGVSRGVARDFWNVQWTSGDDSESSLGRELKIRITGYDHSDASRMDGCLVGEVL